MHGIYVYANDTSAIAIFFVKLPKQLCRKIIHQLLPTHVWIEKKLFLISMAMHDYYKHIKYELNDSQQTTETSSLFRLHDPV